MIAKVIVLGNCGVGKTNIISENYSEKYSATIGVDFFTKQIVVEN